MRKSAGLVATDDGVTAIYSFDDADNSVNKTELLDAIQHNHKLIEETAHVVLVDATFSTDGKQVLGESTSSVHDTQFKVVLTRK